MIDFHCHLDLYPTPAATIEECRKRCLTVLSVTTTPTAWQGTNALVKGEERIFTALGLHPQLANQRRCELDLFDELISSVRYVGEIGLDGTPEFRQHWNDQIAVFKHILSSCQRVGGRIMSIHSRRASREVLDHLKAYDGAGIPILHWFSGSLTDLNRSIQQGCWFSVGPAMLYTERGQALCARIPLKNLLTETDGPFVSLKGRTCMPWDVDVVVEQLSKLYKMSPEELQQQLYENLYRLLGSI
jgi:TatD DNase family protein